MAIGSRPPVPGPPSVSLSRTLLLIAVIFQAREQRATSTVGGLSKVIHVSGLKLCRES